MKQHYGGFEFRVSAAITVAVMTYDSYYSEQLKIAQLKTNRDIDTKMKLNKHCNRM